jgi:peroxiredoxin
LKRSVILLLAALVLVGTAAAQSAPVVASTQLKVGEAAPDFTLLSDQWQPVHLTDYRGKKNVVLAFYVLAFTPG